MALGSILWLLARLCDKLFSTEVFSLGRLFAYSLKNVATSILCHVGKLDLKFVMEDTKILKNKCDELFSGTNVKSHFKFSKKEEIVEKCFAAKNMAK